MNGETVRSQACLFAREDLTISKKDGYDVITLKNCLHTYEVGKPLLPLKLLHIPLSPGESVESIKLLSCNKKYLGDKFNPFPTQPAVPIGEKKEFMSPQYTEEIYPSDIVELKNQGIKDGNRVACVAIHPVQFILAKGGSQPEADEPQVHASGGKNTGELVFYEEISFSIETKSVSPPELHRFRLSTAKMAVPPNKIKPYFVTKFPSLKGESVDYVIITIDEFEGEFERLRDWKTQKGINAVIRTVSWIDLNYPGCDTPERIRNFLKDCYAFWGTKWVLLGGGVNYVPIRYCFVNVYYDGGEFIPTDLYYFCLDGNFNSNGDHIFGEVEDDLCFANVCKS